MPQEDQGMDDSRYDVIPRTLIFLFNDREDVLLLQGADTKPLWAGLYNGFGGHIEAGETIYEAAQRELQEETGLTDITLQFCGQIMVDVSSEAGIALFIFRGEYLGNSMVDSSEGRAVWITLDNLDKYPLVEDINQLIPRVAKFQEGDNLIIGKYQYSEDKTLLIMLG